MVSMKLFLNQDCFYLISSTVRILENYKIITEILRYCSTSIYIYIHIFMF